LKLLRDLLIVRSGGTEQRVVRFERLSKLNESTGEKCYTLKKTLFYTVSDSETTGEGIAIGVGVGLALGVGVGVAMDNIGLGIGIGMALGAALGLVWDQQGA
jgi:hypothetical protein